jgi:membrane fusion protein, epimerase transport system
MPIAATLPATGAMAPSTPHQLRRLARIGLLTVLGIVVPLGAWMGFAPLSMAVVAPAHVKVDLNRRPVQHLEGGIVREVLVRDGQLVKAGDPVVVLGDVGVDADQNRLTYRLAVERAALERLDAEQRRAPVLVFSKSLRAEADKDSRVQEALTKESQLFAARQHSLNSEVALMKQSRARVEQEREALKAQIAQAENALALQRKDLQASQSLVSEGFISGTRVTQMEAAVADYASRLEERRSELARSEGRLVDSDIRSNGLINEYTRSASDQLKTTAARIGEIEQELRKTSDATKRQVVVAPAAGEIIDLKFTSPGSVVRPGEAIAEVVPSDTPMLLEAQIRPEEVNHVFVGQPVRIKFTAFKYRNTTMVTGKVRYVSADRFTDKVTQAPYYGVSIVADAASLRDADDLKLQAGMPAEVYLDGGTQTALQYMVEPITSVWRKAGRQM